MCLYFPYKFIKITLLPTKVHSITRIAEISAEKLVMIDPIKRDHYVLQSNKEKMDIRVYKI